MMDASITSQDFHEISWLGHWIWVPEEPILPSPGFAAAIDMNAQEAHGLFRKKFDLKVVPERAPARIAADSRYALFVNGKELGRGPIRSQFRRLQYDLYDLAPYLKQGTNVLAVYVKYYGREKAFWMPATPNRTLGRRGVFVFEGNLGTSGWLVSDETWKGHKASAWSTNTEDERDLAAEGVPIEIFDARLFPFQWGEADFDDSGWGNARIIPAMYGGTYRSQPPTNPYGPLYPRSVAPLQEEIKLPNIVEMEMLAELPARKTGDPIQSVDNAFALPRLGEKMTINLPASLDLPGQGGGWIKIDMGGIVSGFVQFEVQAAAGTILDLSYMEEPIRLGSQFGRMRAGTRYIARSEHDRFELFDTIGFRYAYIFIHGNPGQVTLSHFGVREYLYPWVEQASFACSDPQLEAIFKAGLRTVQLCSPDALVDCPTREQRAWTGDGIVHQMVHLAANQDWRMAARYVELGNSPRPDGILPMFTVSLMELMGGFTLPDWSMHWVHGVYNYYRYSGDREMILAWLPTVVRILRWYQPYQTSAGLLKDVTEWNLVDWSSVSTSDTSSLLTAEWARGLRELAEMAAWLGEESTRGWVEERYERAKNGFEVFWDEKRGSYIDHIVEGVKRPEMSQIAGALAIVSGLAPQERWERIIATITDSKKLVVRSWAGGGQDEKKFEDHQRGILHYDWDVENEIVIAEPFMSYVVHDAVALAGQAERLPDLYLRWLEFLKDGYDTIGENWGTGTHAHGWSCTPTRDMLIYTLGITPLEPGFTRARVAPRRGRLAWVKGSVPTPYGPISIEVNREIVKINSPIPAELCLENGSVHELTAGQHVVALTVSK
jgi:alpha-L-rhamnosidase